MHARPDALTLAHMYMESKRVPKADFVLFAVVSKRVAGTWFGKRGMKYDTRYTGQVVTIQQERWKDRFGNLPAATRML